MFERIREARKDTLELVRTALRSCRTVPSVVCEIGVSEGFFAAVCLGMFPDVRYVGIDPWKFTLQYRRTLPNRKWRVLLSRPGVMEGIYKSAMARVSFAGDRARLLRMTSGQAVGQFADGSFTLVRIDGDHSYAGCLADMTAYWPKVAQGGILCGDDFCDKYTHTVCKAVRDWCGAQNLEFAVIGKQTWWVGKTQEAV